MNHTSSVRDPAASRRARSVSPELPHQPRPLGRRERSREDLYVFHSPRNGRIVTVVEPLRLAAAVRLEFDPTCVAYVERPRQLVLAEKRWIDLTFWSRHRDGREHYWLVIPAPDTEPVAGGRRAPRRGETLNEAAGRSQITLDYVFESQLLAERERLATYFRLLPYVQAAARVRRAAEIRQLVLERYAALPRATFAHLEQSLPAFNPHDVRAVVATMIHGGALTLDAGIALSRSSVLERGGDAHARV